MDEFVDCYVTPREIFDWSFPTVAPDLKTDYPLTDWLRSTTLKGPWYFKVLFVVGCLMWLFVTAMVVDFCLWLVKLAIKQFMESFGDWFMKISVIFVFAFFTFWLIKSGKWVDLFDFCSGLFSFC